MKSDIFKKLFNKENTWAFLFIAPAFLGILLFIVLPVITSFFISFCHWDLISPIKFVGFNNYIEILNEPLFYKVLWNTFFYSFFTAFFGVILPLFLALLLNQKIKFSNFYKLSIFIPYVTPMIVCAIVWEWIYDPNYSIINWLLGANHGINWLYDKNIALWALIIASIWKNIGYNLIIFLAALQNIPETYSEAAEIDGANSINRFFLITLPLLSPTVFFVLIMTTVSSFQIFDMVYLMTGGGPENSTMVMVYWMYKNAFELFKLGKASAIAYILFLIILGLTLIQWKTRKKWVLNE
ncbi:MAG: sugar ABC transporter permease [bacterium]